MPLGTSGGILENVQFPLQLSDAFAAEANFTETRNIEKILDIKLFFNAMTLNKRTLGLETHEQGLETVKIMEEYIKEVRYFS